MNRMGLLTFLARLPGYGLLQHGVQNRRFRRWVREGKPLPPPHRAKQECLRTLAREQGLRILVETGTLFGDMLHALRHDFDELYSIELSQALYRQARRRFRSLPHIHLLQGDSGQVLAPLLDRLTAPALFWLDGHYSGAGTALGSQATPVFQELDAIFHLKQPFAVAIDDARLFGSDPAYPSLDALRSHLQTLRPGSELQVQDDIIRILPAAP